MTPILQHVHNIELVLRKDLGKTIGGFHARCGGFRNRIISTAPIEKLIGRMDIGAQSQLEADLPGDSQVITGHHLYFDAMLLGLFNRFG